MVNPHHFTGDERLEPGWYAVLICWEAREGFFPEGVEWLGTGWNTRDPISHFWPVRFDSQDEAREFSRKHDPNW